MNKLLSFGCSGLIIFGCLAPALAKPLETRIAQTSPDISTPARDLIIEPRIGGGVSTSGAGTPRFSFLEGFAPLLQTPGESLLFLEGRLSWLDYERVGTNLILGHRLFDPSGDRIFGGYISYDSQDTGNHRFNQIGFGFERLGEDWDLRFNGYVPIGENRKQVGSAVSTTSNASISDFGFQGHLLLFSGTQTREDTTQYEAAMFALDGEAGGKLLDIGDFGQVRGYGGLYYLNGTRSTTLGWRARLEARGLENYRLGLGVQHDGVFGTNFTFHFGVDFGGSSQRKPEENLLARMGDFVTRNHVITIDEQTEITTSSETFSDVVATNPVTGEPWFFQHVSNTGSGGGDGTFENPFGTIVEGTNEANTNSANNQNEIVYVQFGSNITNATAITVPDSVQLLSIAPTQTIETQLGTLQLPSSGAGTSQRPQINATVTMGNNSVLSGFHLNNFEGNGIVANDTSGFTIEESALSSITGNGISTNNASGFIVTNTSFDAIAGHGLSASNSNSFTLSNTPFSNITQDGISASGSSGFTVSNASFSAISQNGISAISSSNNFTVSNTSFETITQNGISTSGSSGFTIGNNTFNNVTQNGIVDSGSSGFTISGNTLNAITQNGISTSGSSGFTVKNNTFNNVTQNGILDSGSSGFTISNNTFNNITRDGISTSNSNSFTINNNTLDTIAEIGIFAENATSYTIEGNTLTNITQYGIQGGVNDGSSIGNIVVQNNTLNGIGNDGSNTGSSSTSNLYDGIFFGASNTSTISDITISGNTISDVENDGIAVGATGTSTLTR
ncbi:MAG: right-handed parallel beta-helix repeat-containing protein, partial [Cyanobacteria bacterium SBLK]|nr:right-handed parallel beta-helix repeat-containing protein [Cyanobacteria bacterium SBLK]